MKPKPPPKPALPFIFVTLLLDMLGLGLILPVMPGLVADLSGVQASQSYGLLIAIYALAQLLASPLLGSLSDRIGRRPVLLGSTLLAAVAYLMITFSPSLGFLMLARALSGVAAASAGVANAFIADLSTPENRARHFGMVGAALSLGLIVGPALGGILGQHGLRLPFMVAAGWALLNGLYGLVFLQESLPREKRHTQKPDPRIGFQTLWNTAGLRVLGWVSLLTSLALQCITSTWVLHGANRYQWGPSESGLALTAAGVLGVMVQVFLVGKVLKKLGIHASILLALLCGTVGYLMYGMASQAWMFYLFMPISCLMGIGGPALQAQVAARTPTHLQGNVQGSFSALGSLAGVLGPLVATQLFEHFTRPSSMQLPGVAFFAASLLVLSAAVVYHLQETRQSSASHTQIQ